MYEKDMNTKELGQIQVAVEQKDYGNKQAGRLWAYAEKIGITKKIEEEK